METENILRLLSNSGFNILASDNMYIYLEDPACITRAFQTFTEYAWAIICVITGMLFFGWAISMIRGAKNDLFTNTRNLILILGTLSIAGPIVNAIYGDDLFAQGCRTINVSINEIKQILKTKDLSNLDKITKPNDYPVSQNNSNSDSPENTPHAISAIQTSAKTVVYTTPDGQRFQRSNGSAAWRNFNPGNIQYGKFAQSMGAIGRAGRWAVFPDEETGMAAIRALMRTGSYRNLTIAHAIEKYAPPHENDTVAYYNHIEKLTGLSINRRVGDLNDAELDSMAHAIKIIEGWIPGQTTFL
ncbi:MAG: hypothetical protein MJ187_01575 [Alphaproteobacteria bacterium]|nr:hypothetical protein [Alphaproteobacteria bacterium]